MSKVPGDNKPEYFVVPSGVFTLEECKVRVKKPAQEWDEMEPIGIYYDKVTAERNDKDHKAIQKE